MTKAERRNTHVEENLKSKSLYKIELMVLKIIPIILAGLTLLNTILSYFDIDLPILSFIGSTSVLFLIFLYLSSIVFRFCKWHRMFLHYVSVTWSLQVIDYSISIPVDDITLFTIYIIISIIFTLLIFYYRINEQKYIKACRQIVKGSC